jgi:hypothetical protein
MTNTKGFPISKPTAAIMTSHEASIVAAAVPWSEAAGLSSEHHVSKDDMVSSANGHLRPPFSARVEVQGCVAEAEWFQRRREASSNRVLSSPSSALGHRRFTRRLAAAARHGGGGSTTEDLVATPKTGVSNTIELKTI